MRTLTFIIAAVTSLLLSACDDVQPVLSGDAANPASIDGETDAQPPGVGDESTAMPVGDGPEEVSEGGMSTAETPPTAMVDDGDTPAAGNTGREAQSTPTFNGVDFDGPIVIRQGGTYQGNWESTDPDTAAVTIATQEPVTIERSNIRSRGHLVASSTDRTAVTIRQTTGVALDPQRAGAKIGRFAFLLGGRRALIENNDIHNTSGIFFGRYHGSDRNDYFKVLRNRVVNVDGRLSTGSGFNQDDSTAWLAHFVSVSQMQSVPNVAIGWNHVVNQPGKSRVEDVVSVYLSSGLADSPIRIFDNFIDGAYPTHPEYDRYSGGGIMLGDGKANPEGVKHVIAERNVVVNTTNYGMAISAGENTVMRNNRVFSTGRLPNGTPVAAQNVGIYVWNYHDQGAFGNNDAINNVVGWENVKRGGQYNFYMPDVDTAEGNATYSGDVSDEMLDREFAAWRGRANANNVSVGHSD